uniref:Nuclear receptor domain-containing protein n=1 Tax=Parastrongyloides trichosuri TaxID=131310 RepID=A0A0N4Z715_PARTI
MFLFFRRSVVLQIQFECLYDGMCEVNFNIKNVCKCCRFNKCIQMGMNKNKVQKPRGKYSKRKELMQSNTPSPRASCIIHSSNQTFVREVEYDCNEFLDQFIHMEYMTEKRRIILTGSNPLLILRDPIQGYSVDKSYKIVPFNFKQFNACVRNVCLLSFDYTTSMPYYNTFNEEDKYTIFRGVFFLTCILDSSFFTYKSGLYKEGYYAGIEGMVSSIYDDKYGWETEGNITREMKLTLLKPIYKNIFESLILPMANLNMEAWEFASFKGMCISNICSYDFSIDGKKKGKKFDNLFIKGLTSGRYKNDEEMSVRVGQIILLMTNLHVIYASMVEFFTRLDVFNLIELDSVIKALLNRTPLCDLDRL